jgi:hypothetical protein
MARSKQLHYLTARWDTNNPADPNNEVVNSWIDIPRLLSEKLGRNIRQSQITRVVGYGIHIAPKEDTVLGVDDFDIGGAVSGHLYYLSPTATTISAYKDAFRRWSAQQKLTRTGGLVAKYDDFEVGLHAKGALGPYGNYYGSNTSTLWDNPVGNLHLAGDPHPIVLTGDSDDLTPNYERTSLQDVCNSANQHLQIPIFDEFGNTFDQGDKFGGSPYPDLSVLGVTATASSQYHNTPLLPNGMMGGVSMQDLIFLPADNHLNIQNGLVGVKLWLFPPDSLVQIEDDFTITVTLVVEGWTSIFKKPKSRRKSRKYKSARKGYGKSKSRKGYRRR